MRAIINNIQPQTEQHAEAKVHAENKYVGSMQRVAGHTLWQYNYRTGELKAAQVEKHGYFDTAGILPKFRVQVERNCCYVQALNRKNAIKKLHKMGFTLFKCK
jgi:hypothetical protein